MKTRAEDTALAAVDTRALETKRLAPGLQETFFSLYHAHIDRLWDVEISLSIADEASRRWPTATLPEHSSDS